MGPDRDYDPSSITKERVCYVSGKLYVVEIMERNGEEVGYSVIRDFKP